MDNQHISQSITTAKELLQEADSVGILVTEYQTLDKVGAGLALYLSLLESGKSVQIISKKDPIVEISNLVGIDKLSKSFDGVTKKLVVSLPYHEGEVEKVSYNIEGNRLNINLFATQDKGISFAEKDVDFIKSGSNPSVIVTIGIRKQEEMSDFVPVDSNARIIRLDTVTPQQDFGEVTIAGTEFSSISEIVTMIIREMRLPINIDIAQNLMDGVVHATNNFSLPQTSSAAFASAAYLLANNARRKSTRSDSRQAESRQQEQKRPQQSQRNTDSRSEGRAPLRRDSGSHFQPVEGDGPSQKQQESTSELKTEEIVQQPEVNTQDQNEEEVPSDWFVPKVFKSSKAQE